MQALICCEEKIKHPMTKVSEPHLFHADPDPGFQYLRIRILGLKNLRIRIQGFIFFPKLTLFGSEKSLKRTCIRFKMQSRYRIQI